MCARWPRSSLRSEAHIHVIRSTFSVGSCIAGLYTPQDHIEILDDRNFERLVYGSDKIWVVEFYAQWWYEACLPVWALYV